VALDAFSFHVLVFNAQTNYFFHHENFGHHVSIINFIDLISHQNGLFVRFVIKLGNLVDSLFCPMNVTFAIFIFLTIGVNGVGYVFFSLV
jgi:hypothetical protein